MGNLLEVKNLTKLFPVGYKKNITAINSISFEVHEGETLADYLWSQLITENFSELETEIIHFCLDSLENR